MQHTGLTVLVISVSTVLSFPGESPANSDVAVEDSFDRKELGKNRHVSACRTDALKVSPK